MATHSTEVVKLTGKIVARSKAAVLFAIFPSDLDLSQEEFVEAIKAKNPDVVQEWIPLSQTKAIGETFSLVTDALDTITITQWIAKTKGFI